MTRQPAWQFGPADLVLSASVPAIESPERVKQASFAQVNRASLGDIASHFEEMSP